MHCSLNVLQLINVTLANFMNSMNYLLHVAIHASSGESVYRIAFILVSTKQLIELFSAGNICHWHQIWHFSEVILWPTLCKVTHWIALQSVLGLHSYICMPVWQLIENYSFGVKNLVIDVTRILEESDSSLGVISSERSLSDSTRP